MRKTVSVLVAAFLLPVGARGQGQSSADMECFDQSGPRGFETWCRKGDERPFRLHPREVTTASSSFQPTAYRPPGRFVSSEAADSIARGSLKYSWSGPLKWGAISAGLSSLVLFASSTEEVPLTAPALGTLLIGAGFLAIGVALDASAAKDFARAAGVTSNARRDPRRW